MYNYLIVGSGLFGSVCAYELNKANMKVLVVEKRNHIGGNVYTETENDITIHKYGAHIFHTSDKFVWDYINKFDTFNNYINSPIANYKGEIYNLPFNMNTFSKLWNITTPEQAGCRIKEEIEQSNISTISNLEEQAISLVGKTIYEKLIKGYTEKQWGKNCKDLPPEIIKRLPVRYTYNNNYFNDKYQGIPEHGYTYIIEKLLEGIDVITNTNYLQEEKMLNKLCKNVIYTGPIDEYYNYQFGKLEYRSLRFETELLDVSNYQGNAVVNYTDRKTPYTRIIEHKHFTDVINSKQTYITKEYPDEWNIMKEPYYPINNKDNNDLYTQYTNLKPRTNLIFGGRLGYYQYLDMDKIIDKALSLTRDIKYNII